MRKMKLDAATEKFQRKPEKKRPPVHENNIGGKLFFLLMGRSMEKPLHRFNFKIV